MVDFLRLALWSAVWMRRVPVIGLVGCARSAVVIGRISRLLLRLVVRTQTQHSAAGFDDDDADPRLLGEETDPTSLPVLARLPTWYLSQPPIRQGLTQVQWPEGRLSRGWEKEKLGSSRDSNPVRLCWSSAHLGQCEPDETCWTRTQTWTQA